LFYRLIVVEEKSAELESTKAKMLSKSRTIICVGEKNEEVNKTKEALISIFLWYYKINRSEG